MSDGKGFMFGFVAGAILACAIWMVTYWPDAAAREEALRRCEAVLDHITEAQP
jgi:hypothetical protein